MNEPAISRSPRAPAGTRTIDVKGQRLRIAIRPGDGTRTPLLLMNGIGANLELLQPFVDALDPAIEVIRFDVPGVGGSPAPRLPYRFASLARLMARMLDQLGYDRVDVLGISWGGGLAQQFAVQQPRRCRRLILVSTSTGALMVPARPAVLAKLVTPRRYLDRSYLESIAPDLYGGSARSNPQLARGLAQSMHGTSRRGYLYQLLAGMGWTSVLWLRRVRQPTLIMSGDDDPIIPLANAKIMQRLIPHARLHVFHGGHLGLVTEADQLAPVVAQFLAQEEQQLGTGPAPGRLRRIGRAIRQRLKQVLTHVRQRRTP
jgi:poly(3-hydroxyalkanoate) depolymerase